MTDRGREQVHGLEASIEAIRLPMEVVCDEFVDATAAALAAFWPGYVDQCIVENGPRLATMSDQEVGALKREVEEVIADPHAACRRELVEHKPERWPHLLSLEKLIERVRGVDARGLGYGAFRRVSSNEPAPALWFGVDLAAGAVAKPFHAAGLTPPLANIDEGGCRVAYGQSWPVEMDDAGERYSSLAFQMEEALRTLAGARLQDDAQSSRDRWDGA